MTHWITRSLATLMPAVVIGLGALAVDAGAVSAAGFSSEPSRDGSTGVDQETSKDFVAVEPILVQATDEAGNLRTVVLSLTLELGTRRGDGARVAAYMPRLRDAYLRELSPPPFVEGRLDLVTAKAILRRVTDQVLGPAVVRDVLIQRVHDSNAG